MMKTLINNKKAGFDYFLEEPFIAGMQLLGWEVKSLKNSRGSLEGSFVRIINSEAFLIGCKIGKWEKSYKSIEMQDMRNIKLLLRKREIAELSSRIAEEGFSVVPTKIFEDVNKRIKIEIFVAQGKKKYDKRRKKEEKFFRKVIAESI